MGPDRAEASVARKVPRGRRRWRPGHRRQPGLPRPSGRHLGRVSRHRRRATVALRRRHRHYGTSDHLHNRWSPICDGHGGLGWRRRAHEYARSGRGETRLGPHPHVRPRRRRDAKNAAIRTQGPARTRRHDETESADSARRSLAVQQSLFLLPWVECGSRSPARSPLFEQRDTRFARVHRARRRASVRRDAFLQKDPHCKRGGRDPRVHHLAWTGNCKTVASVATTVGRCSTIVGAFTTRCIVAFWVYRRLHGSDPPGRVVTMSDFGWAVARTTVPAIDPSWSPTDG